MNKIFLLFFSALFVFPSLALGNSLLLLLEDAIGVENIPVEIVYMPDTIAGATPTEKVAIVFYVAVNFILYVVGIGAVVMIVYAGFRMVTAVGQEDQITLAKQTLLYAVLGLLAVILSLVVVRAVISRIFTT